MSAGCYTQRRDVMRDLAKRKPTATPRVSSVTVQLGTRIYHFWDEKELTAFIAEIESAKEVSFP